MTISLEHYLVLSALLFGIGLYGALSRRSAIIILICVEIMLSACNILLTAFSRYISPLELTGQVFVIFSIIVAAAEVTLGLAIIIAIYRKYESIDVNKTNSLKW